MADSFNDLNSRIKKYLVRRSSINTHEYSYLIQQLYHPPMDNQKYVGTLMFLMKNLVPRVQVHEWYCRTHQHVEDVNIMTDYIVPSLMDPFIDVRSGYKTVQAPRAQYLHWLYLPIDCDDSTGGGDEPVEEECDAEQIPEINTVGDFTRQVTLGGTYPYSFEVSIENGVLPEDIKVVVTDPLDGDNIIQEFTPDYNTEVPSSFVITYSEENGYKPQQYEIVISVKNCKGPNTLTFFVDVSKVELQLQVCISNNADSPNNNYKVNATKDGYPMTVEDKEANPIELYIVVEDKFGEFIEVLVGTAYEGVLDFTTLPLADLVDIDGKFIEGFWVMEVRGESDFSLSAEIGHMPQPVAAYQFVTNVSSAHDGAVIYKPSDIDTTSLFVDTELMTILDYTDCETKPGFCGILPVGTEMYPQLTDDPVDVQYRVFVADTQYSIPQLNGLPYEFVPGSVIPPVVLEHKLPYFTYVDAYDRTYPALAADFVFVEFGELISKFELDSGDGNDYLVVEMPFTAWANDVKLTLDTRQDFLDEGICLCIEIWLVDKDGTEIFYSGELFYKPFIHEHDYEYKHSIQLPEDLVNDFPAAFDIRYSQKVTYCNPPTDCFYVGSAQLRKEQEIQFIRAQFAPPEWNPGTITTLPSESVTYVTNSVADGNVTFKLTPLNTFSTIQYRRMPGNITVISDKIDLNTLPVGTHHLEITATTPQGLKTKKFYAINILPKPTIQIVNQTNTPLYNNDPGNPSVVVTGLPAGVTPTLFLDTPTVDPTLKTYASQKTCFNDFLAYINNKRTTAGLGVLQFSDVLLKAAYEHAKDMDLLNYGSHMTLNPTLPYYNKGPQIRIRYWGYPYNNLVAESIWPFAGGCSNAIGAYEALDAGHKAMFMNKNYTQIGLAFVGNRWVFLTATPGEGPNVPREPLELGTATPVAMTNIPIAPLYPGNHVATGYVIIDGVKIPLESYNFNVQFKSDTFIKDDDTHTNLWYYNKNGPGFITTTTSLVDTSELSVTYKENNVTITDTHMSAFSLGFHIVDATVTHRGTITTKQLKFYVGPHTVEKDLPGLYLRLDYNSGGFSNGLFARPMIRSQQLTTVKKLPEEYDPLNTGYGTPFHHNFYIIPVYSHTAKASGVPFPPVHVEFSMNSYTFPYQIATNFHPFYWHSGVTPITGGITTDGVPSVIEGSMSIGTFVGKNYTVTGAGFGIPKVHRFTYLLTNTALTAGFNLFYIRFEMPYGNQTPAQYPLPRPFFHRQHNTFPGGLKLMYKSIDQFTAHTAITDVTDVTLNLASGTEYNPTSLRKYDGIYRIKQSDVIKWPSFANFCYIIFNHDFGPRYFTSDTLTTPTTFNNVDTGKNYFNGDGKQYVYFKNVAAVMYFEKDFDDNN